MTSPVRNTKTSYVTRYENITQNQPRYSRDINLRGKKINIYKSPQRTINKSPQRVTRTYTTSNRVISKSPNRVTYSTHNGVRRLDPRVVRVSRTPEK